MADLDCGRRQTALASRRQRVVLHCAGWKADGRGSEDDSDVRARGPDPALRRRRVELQLLPVRRRGRRTLLNQHARGSGYPIIDTNHRCPELDDAVEEMTPEHSSASAHHHAATIVPRHSPRPMRVQPSRSHQPLKITSSPSSRNARVSPVGSVIGCVPRHASSSRHPRDSRVGPDTVPLAIRSPARRLQPLLA